jgi:hypothetical protein
MKVPNQRKTWRMMSLLNYPSRHKSRLRGKKDGRLQLAWTWTPTRVTLLHPAVGVGVNVIIGVSCPRHDIYYFPTVVVSDSEPGATIDATLPSSRKLSVWFVNPNLSLPHTCFLRSFLPSPNCSFHLRRSARLPSASEEDGVISLRALLK